MTITSTATLRRSLSRMRAFARWAKAAVIEADRVRADNNSLAVARYERRQRWGHEELLTRWAKTAAREDERLKLDDTSLAALNDRRRQRSDQVEFLVHWTNAVAVRAGRLSTDDKPPAGVERRGRLGTRMCFACWVSRLASQADCLNTGNFMMSANRAPQRA